MKSLLLEKDGNFVIKETLRPQSISVNHALIKIKSCGICSSDFDRIFGKSAYYYPIILGHEFSGEIVDINSENSSFKIGDVVTIFPLLPCFNCNACKQKRYAQCENYKYFGSRCDGGLQEYLEVPVWNLVKCNQLSAIKSALLEPAAVALNAIKRANLENSHDSVLVIGTGIIGIFVGLFARYFQSNVKFYIREWSSSENILKNLQFDTINTFNAEEKFGCVFECVGSNNSIETALKYCESFGQIILVGNPHSDVVMNKNSYWKILRKEINILGCWNSRFPDDWIQAVKILENLELDELQLVHTSNSLESLISDISLKYSKEIKKPKVMWINE